MKKIYLVRHAQPELGGREHVCLGGRSDPPLSAEGRAQAEKLGRQIPSLESFGVWASPMLRARETAELIAGGRAMVNILPGMEEIDCGDWDGLSFDEIRRLYPVLYARRGGDLSLTPPGGESLEALARRGLRALESLMDAEEDNIILVAHKGINRVLLCALMGKPLCGYRSLSQDYVCVNVLSNENGKLKVEAIGVLPEEFSL